MTPELDAFIAHFSDEDQLRSAIEGLLCKRQEYSGIRNLHGKDEAGKDLIFYAPSGLGRPKLHACVVKLGKITGSASDSNTGARNVVIQCNQALDTPIINTHGHKEWVSQVYVMCPNELSATAMQSISGAFEGRPSQIEFICGQELLQMFREIWPDFIFFQPDLLSAHLDTLGKELACDQNIQRLASVHGLSASSQKYIYIEPLLTQEIGRFSRGTRLYDHSDFSQLGGSGESPILERMFQELVTSLKIVDYLSPDYENRRERARRELPQWPARFQKAWSDAYNWAVNDAYSKKVRPPSSVAIPKNVIQKFLGSKEHRFLSEIYAELDREIEEANIALQQSADRIALLDSPAFPNYGSLLNAKSTCFPTIQFETATSQEWSPEEVLAPNRNVLITGAPGFGKTSFCRYHFLLDLDRFRKGATLVPLYFAAHSILVGQGKSFEDIFVRHEVAAKLASDPSVRVRMYLDGIDEIKSKDLRDCILRIVKEACLRDGGRYRCVATARDHVGGYWSNWLSRVVLSPMSPDKLRELVTAWLDGDPELISLFYSELSRSESLIPVLGVPLLATLTILVFKNLHRLPENKLRLYQMFIDLLLGGWNLAKGLQRHSRYSSTAKLLVLTRLAGLMHAQKKKECDNAQISTALAQSAPGLATQLEGVISEFVEDGLLLPTGRLSYIFPHLSFQEYLAARDAIDPARQEEKRVVSFYLAGDDWYKEVATFLVSMTTNPQRMRSWIVDLGKQFSSPLSGLSEGERRAGYLIGRLSDMFPECRPQVGH